MRTTLILACLVVALALPVLRRVLRRGRPNYLANNIVLIIRHAEKPEAGNHLTALGQARARAYATYFAPFRDAAPGIPPFTVDNLYAGADSARSIRPRLTLEPLAEALQLPLDTTVGTKNPASLLHLLRTRPHGEHPLIAWRHGQIPLLLRTLGADPAGLLPDGQWPSDCFDWTVLLSFDAGGRLRTQLLLPQRLDL